MSLRTCVYLESHTLTPFFRTQKQPLAIEWMHPSEYFHSTQWALPMSAHDSINAKHRKRSGAKSFICHNSLRHGLDKVFLRCIPKSYPSRAKVSQSLPALAHCFKRCAIQSAKDLRRAMEAGEKHKDWRILQKDTAKSIGNSIQSKTPTIAPLRVIPVCTRPTAVIIRPMIYALPAGYRLLPVTPFPQVVTLAQSPVPQ